LVTADLSRDLGVSATPVREALLLLERDGLVEIIPRKGTFVSSVDLDGARDLFALRKILEGAAAEQAASRISDQDLAALEAFCRAPNDSGRPQLTPRLGSNASFHVAVASCSGNRRLAELIRTLLEEMRRIIVAGFVPDDHAEILAALRERDGTKARAAMIQHICHVEDRVFGRSSSGQ
jgi:DNA-binding GntR family transcriptional regulator